MKILTEFHNMSEHAKQVGDAVATVSGVGAFSAVTLANLQGVALIASIIASVFSIGWIAIRVYDRIKYGPVSRIRVEK